MEYQCYITVKLKRKDRCPDVEVEPLPPEKQDDPWWQKNHEIDKGCKQAKLERDWHKKDPIEQVTFNLSFKLPFVPVPGIQLFGPEFPFTLTLVEVCYHTGDLELVPFFSLEADSYIIYEEEHYLKRIWQLEKAGWEEDKPDEENHK